jgi:TonB family protein
MALALIAALMMQAAAAAPARPPASTADLPAWSRTPTGEDMAHAYPADPAKQNLAGSAVVECTVAAGGDLTACAVASENPVGMGFGQAALSLAPKFQLPTKAPSGATTVGRTVQFPVRWLNNAKTEAPLIQVFDDAGRSGNVVFNCRVREDRKVDNCVAVDARPRGTTLFAYAGEQVMRATAPRSVNPGDRVMMVVEVRPNNR